MPGYWTIANGTRIIYNVPGSTPPAYAPNSPNRGMTLTSGSATVEVPAPPSGNPIGVGNAGFYGGGRLIKEGPGEFSLWLRCSNVAGNTNTGGITVNAGTLSVVNVQNTTTDNDRTFGAVPATLDPAYVKLAGGTTFVVLDGGAVPTNFAATRGFQLIAGTAAPNTPITIVNEAGGPPMNFNSPISSDTGVTSELVFAGKNTTNAAAQTRTIILSNSTNSWAGDTLVTSIAPFFNGFAATTGLNTTMVLRTGANNALPATTNLFLQARDATSVTTLDLGNTGSAGFNQTIAGLYAGTDTSGTGQLGDSTVTNSGNTAASLTINNAAPMTPSPATSSAPTSTSITPAPARWSLPGAANNFGGLDGTGNTTIGDGTNAVTVTANHFVRTR